MIKGDEKMDLISFIVDSDKRKNLLTLLREGSKSLNEIKERLMVTSSGMIPQIRKMEERKLIKKNIHNYELTEIGDIVADYFYNFEILDKIFKNNEEFWNNHKISAIPEKFRVRLHEFGNYELIRSNLIDIFKPDHEDMKNLMNISMMKGISPIMNPDYPQYICDLAEKGVNISLIITEEIMEILKNNYIEELKRCSGLKNICISIYHEKIEFALAVTDHFLSLRLFLKNGDYDNRDKIISFDKSAIGWGEDIFNHYIKRTEKIIISDVLQCENKI